MSSGEDRAHAGDDLAVAVRLVFDDQRAVEGRSRPFDRQRGAQALFHFADQRIERRASHGATRRGVGGNQRHRRGPVRSREHREEARHLGAGITVAGEHLVAAVEGSSSRRSRPWSGSGEKLLLSCIKRPTAILGGMVGSLALGQRSGAEARQRVLERR